MNRQGRACAIVRGLIHGALLCLAAYAAAWLVIGHPPIP